MVPRDGVRALSFYHDKTSALSSLVEQSNYTPLYCSSDLETKHSNSICLVPKTGLQY